jgi:nicotinate-nucleotide adenylyltransferase
MTNKRIGLFGGTFDPIHLGHLIVAQEALEVAQLDKIVFIPAFSPPHKSQDPLSPAADRLAMVQTVLMDDKRFVVSSYEVDKGGTSYTVETLQHFSHEFPSADLFFIMGADSFQQIMSWKNPQQIAKMATLLVIARPGFLVTQGEIPYKSVVIPELPISSSIIRDKIRAGKSIKYLVPESAFHYIKKHNLYHLREGKVKG